MAVQDLSEQIRVLADDERIVDALTGFLYDDCGMGGAADYYTRKVIQRLADLAGTHETAPPSRS